MKWRCGSNAPQHKKFTARHVNALKHMVDRHLSMPHHLVCVTDDPEGLDPEIRVLPLSEAYRRLPKCYPKITLFSADCRRLVGDRLLYIDLDAVITAPLDPLIPSDEVEFMIHAKPVKFRIGELLRSRTRRKQKKFYRSGVKYNGGLMYMRTGSRSEVFDSFKIDRARAIAERFHARGSDQVWIQHCLGLNERTWGRSEGVHSYGSDLSGKKRAYLPGDARIVLFGGRYTPSDAGVLESSPWIADHYPVDTL